MSIENHKLYKKLKPYFYSKGGLILKFMSHSGVVLQSPVSEFGVIVERVGDYYNVYQLFNNAKTCIRLNVDQGQAGLIMYSFFQSFCKNLIESYRNDLDQSLYNYVKEGINILSYNQYYKRKKGVLG